VEARVAYQWDARFLYVAAQVKEPSLTPRRVDEAPYEFWRGSRRATNRFRIQ
jgi:hypothetical protein